MATRIVYIVILAYLLQRYGPQHRTRDLLHVGMLWLVLALLFEWGGRLLIQHRPVDDILLGWQVWKGYLWPFVLLTYLSANLLVGLVLRAQHDDRHWHGPTMGQANARRLPRT